MKRWMPLSFCPACRLPSRSVIANLPCEECLASLLTAPEICPTCLGFTCLPTNCTRSWLRIDGADSRLRFDSVTSVYLSIGPGARVLKSWKTSPSPSLNRFFRSDMKNRLEKFPLEEPLSLVPVPQSASRRWELAGGSAVRVCQMIRDLRKNPDDRVLDLLEVGPKSTAQAMSQGDERYSRKATIHARADIARTDIEVDFEAVPTIILVDDFLTSGSTLRAAAKATREGLGRLGLDLRLHVFVLGFRPALFDRE